MMHNCCAPMKHSTLFGSALSSSWVLSLLYKWGVSGISDAKKDSTKVRISAISGIR